MCCSHEFWSLAEKERLKWSKMEEKNAERSDAVSKDDTGMLQTFSQIWNYIQSIL
jgi:hypothetical protein